MHIRKLELQGFKSFAERTVFHFGAGISGVVGPNGCGKSNVVDALKWCIGEQSAKSLRGDAMSDVIFGGSVSRAAVSLAEVSITLVAGDTPFPGIWQRYPELEVTRRLYREGQSEYLCNQEKVRLRDIQDLFLDTGVGNQMYSFIEQGRIGQIIHARPEQRRQLIDEAAGINRFKARREETQERLTATRASLERVAERADDLKKQVKSAERAFQKVLRWRLLHARQRQLELAVGLKQFDILIERRRSITDKLRKTREEAEEGERAVTRNEIIVAERRQAQESAEATATQARERQAELETQRRVEESSAQFQQKEQIGNRSRREKLGAEHAETAKERERAATEFEGHRLARQEAERLIVGVRSALDQGSIELLRLETEVKRAREQRDRAQKEAQEAFEAATRAKASLSALDGRRQDLGQRLSKLQAQHQEAIQIGTRLEGDVERTTLAVKAAEAELNKGRGEVDIARASIAKVEAELGSHQKEERLSEVAHTEAQRERDRLRTRIETLEEIQKKASDAPDGLRNALQVPGTSGLLATHLDVPKALEEPLARALDGGLELLIVPDAETALKVAKAAKGARLRMAIGAGTPAPMQGMGAQIEGDNLGKTVLGRLLPDAQTAASLAIALKSWQQGQVWVCDDGAVLRADGVILTGSGDGGMGTATLRRRREIAELRENLSAVDTKVVACRVAQERWKERVRETESALLSGRQAVGRATNELRQRENGVSEARQRQREAESDRTRTQRTIESLAIELRNLEQSSTQFKGEEERLQKVSEEQSTRQSAAEARRLEAVTLLEQAEPALSAISATTQRQRSELSHIQKDLNSAQVAEKSTKERLERSTTRLSQLNAEQQELERRAEEIQAEIQRSTRRLEELQYDIDAVHAQIEATRTQVQTLREDVKRAEAALKAARERRSQAREQVLGLESELTMVKADIERLTQSAEERHGIGLPGLLDRLERDGQVLLEGYTPAWIPEHISPEVVAVLKIGPAELGMDRSKELNDVKEGIGRIGGVNLGAEEEYRELSEQWTALEAQRKDLAEAMDTIEKTLAKINRSCRERFKEAFDLVNRKFTEVYTRLVAGGVARLELTEAEEILECGVEIIVQPPGKRVQNLTLLSGGEKAMAALALIFALFQVKPSPFCVLDEVDAPLDEANGARFNDMLKEMSNQSQFIVVTHNKKTMEGAATLYGVTMPEPGISRLVSVRID